MLTAAWFARERDYEPLIGLIGATLAVIAFLPLAKWLDVLLSILLVPSSIGGYILIRQKQQATASSSFTSIFNRFKSIIETILAFAILFGGIAWYLRNPNYEVLEPVS